MIFEHKSVLLMETVDSLNVKPDGIYVDGTLGGGGHAYEVSRRLGEKGRLIGIDQDADAIAAASTWILVCLHTSWIRRTVDSLTERMPRWI